MKRLSALPVLIALVALHASAGPLQQTVDSAIATVVREFAPKNLRGSQIALTVRVLKNGRDETAAFRGTEPIYPASVVKLFYLAAAHRWLEDGKFKDTPELQRALRDMIVDSSNDATHYIVDMLTDTVSGPELPQTEMTLWTLKRNAVNRHFALLGYKGINTNQKPWCEGPYGRDRVFVGESFANRNALTTDATARLLGEIALGQAVSPARSAAMMALLRRDPFSKTNDPEDQAHGFTGLALKPGAKLWSKAGWTSSTRHDAAYIELPGGARVVLVIFTVDFANERGIIPALATPILDAIQASP